MDARTTFRLAGEALRAQAMDEWTTFRLAGEALRALGAAGGERAG